MDDGRRRRIESAKSGDEPAMALLMEEAWPVVYRFLRSIGASEANAPDLVQDSLVKGMARLDRYAPEKADLHTWLCTIAKNLFVDFLKKERRLSSLEQWYEGNAPVSSFTGHAAGITANTSSHGVQISDMPDIDLRALLANLPAQVRFAILMRYVHGYTNKVIAHMLAVPEGTVKSKVHYGLEKLRKELGRYE
jgi:RNA polymerase sigma-70 factor (ECF subfamily)